MKNIPQEYFDYIWNGCVGDEDVEESIKEIDENIKYRYDYYYIKKHKRHKNNNKQRR